MLKQLKQVQEKFYLSEEILNLMIQLNKKSNILFILNFCQDLDFMALV